MSSRFLVRPLRVRAGFSLIEVVIAIGIFAVAVTAIIGLLLPNTQAVTEQIESDVARRLAENVQAEIQRHARTIAETQKPTPRKGLDMLDDIFFAGAPAGRTNSLFLVATRDGSRVLVTGEDPYLAWNDTYKNPYKPDDATNYPVVLPAAAKRAAENDLITGSTPGDPPGIALRDRYFLIEVFLLQSPPYVQTNTAAGIALPYVPVGVRVVWPYRIPDGPANPLASSNYNSRGTAASPELPWQVVSPAKHSVFNFNLTISP